MTRQLNNSDNTKKNRKQPIARKRRLLPTITSKPKTQTIKTHLGKITKNLQSKMKNIQKKTLHYV